MPNGVTNKKDNPNQANGGAAMFRFGENWAAFLKLLNEERIKEAEASLKKMLNVESLNGKSFMDIGSGSGLFSLAAYNLGAQVISIDYDKDSVTCTTFLKEKFYSATAANWEIYHASVLDEIFMSNLPQVDYVYSWGVLHHTGNMFKAMEIAAAKVKIGGELFIALYRKTIFDKLWVPFKRMYSRCGKSTQYIFQQLWVLKTRLAFLLKGKSFKKMLQDYPQNRGMDFYKDIHDWLGGYPYEAITPENCRSFFKKHGFELIKQNIQGEGVSKALSSGCDEYLFKRISTN